MKRETISKLLFPVLAAVAAGVWIHTAQNGIIDETSSTAKLTYPTSFHKDGKGSLEITSLEPEAELSQDAQERLKVCNEHLEQHPDDPQKLSDAFWILYSGNRAASAVPYAQRLQTVEANQHPNFRQACIIALSQAARFEESERALNAFSESHYGFSQERCAAKMIQYYRCLHACRVLKDPSAASQAFILMVRTDPDAPFMDPYDTARGFFCRFITERIAAGQPLPEQLDRVWAFLPVSDVKLCVEQLQNKGDKPSEAMLAAMDEYNKGRLAPPAAKAQRAMHAYCRRGDKIDLAIELANQSVADARQLGDRGELLDALWRQAFFAHLNGNLETEYLAITEADRLARELTAPGLIARTKTKLGLMLEQFGNYNGAFDAYGKAIRLNERYDIAQCESHVPSPERRWAWQFGKAQVCRAKGDEASAREWLARALATIESQRASLEDFFQRRALLNNKYQVYELGVDIELKKKDLAAAFAFSEKSRARTFLDALGAKAGEARPLPLASLADVQAASDSFATLVFWSRPKELLAWIVRKDGAELMTLPITQAALKELISTCYAEVISGEKAIDWKPWMQKLWSELWAPLEKKLRPDERLCIIPHNVLHYVPFQALHDGKQFLVERHTVLYAPSGTGLVELRKRPGVLPESFAIFDGALELDPKSPFSKTPTEMLRKRYPKAQVFIRQQATEEAFRTSGCAGLIHITAHGSYDTWIPARSGLHLQPAGKEDGVLRAEEIGRLELKDTELVVLCSCVSSVGELADGDEVTGVTRAFQMAGARNVVGSLWPVEVTATNRLMELFYTQLQEHPGDPAMALCEAQRHFLKEDSNPDHWAAFELNGAGKR